MTTNLFVSFSSTFGQTFAAERLVSAISDIRDMVDDTHANYAESMDLIPLIPFPVNSVPENITPVLETPGIRVYLVDVVADTDEDLSVNFFLVGEDTAQQHTSSNSDTTVHEPEAEEILPAVMVEEAVSVDGDETLSAETSEESISDDTSSSVDD